MPVRDSKADHATVEGVEVPPVLTSKPDTGVYTDLLTLLGLILGIRWSMPDCVPGGRNLIDPWVSPKRWVLTVHPMTDTWQSAVVIGSASNKRILRRVADVIGDAYRGGCDFRLIDEPTEGEGEGELFEGGIVCGGEESSLQLDASTWIVGPPAPLAELREVQASHDRWLDAQAKLATKPATNPANNPRKLTPEEIRAIALQEIEKAHKEVEESLGTKTKTTKSKGAK